MTGVNCMIVDDEPLARDIIQTYVSRIPGWNLVKTCINAEEAYEGMFQFKVDVLFLDIHMPVISGIDFIRSLKRPPLVVFTTAYADYAVTGFELHAVDYLVKPVTFDRFFQAIEKVKERMLHRTNVAEQIQADYFFIKQDGRLVKIDYKDILFMEAQRDFTSIYLKNKKMLASMHLKVLEDMLTPPNIIRVHRSYIINLDAVRSIAGNIVEIDGKEIPIGANYKEMLLKRLGL
ncbi:LytR/AlgR family response regulator transcription factor [Chitinophaga tropicalis]|uniref:Response regulator n=1 Tax=Chitinophaga tropicalis TaxID=2683588 RepID=A0A7K1U8G7_9BACT|nr:response regulator transcription factor [Chitinophaga tropicalis]MVT10659.1 response regulator [Chitinophaga tropicalis]